MKIGTQSQMEILRVEIKFEMECIGATGAHLMKIYLK